MTIKNSLWLWLGLLVPAGLGFQNTWAADNSIPIVHILAIDPCASETGQDTASFAVFRQGPTNAALTVHYRVGGSASNGVDYPLLSGEVTVPAGAFRASITLTPFDDLLDEGGESVLIGLVQPLSWPPPYIVCWPSFAFAHIEDNDTLTNRPPLVRLVNPPDGSVFMAPVDITLVASATDPDGRVRTVEFFDGTHSLGIVTNRPPIVRPDGILDDVADEFDPLRFFDLEQRPDIDLIPIPLPSFRLFWEDVPPGEHVLVAVATDNLGASTRSAPVTIKVTEASAQPIVTVKATDPIASEGPRALDPADVRPIAILDTATLTVHRTGPTDLPLTVYYRIGGSAANGLDYRELPYSVVIPPGARAAEVIIQPIDDNLIEGTEDVVLAIVPPVCIEIFPPSPDCYLVGRERVAEAIIHDNDSAPGNRPPVVEIVRPLDGTVFRAPADITIVAQARDFDGRVVTVEFFEGTNSLGVVSNTVSVLTPDRPPFALTWSNVMAGHYVLTAKATDNLGAMGRSRPVEIKVADRTEPPRVCIEAADAEAAEGFSDAINTATFRVSRTGPTDRPLLVFYTLSGSAANGVDYRELSGRVTIEQGSARASIIVIPIDDRLVEGTETVVATLEPSRCLNLFPVLTDCYLVCSDRSARASIRDNDPAPTNNQPPRVAIVRPENGDVFTAPADIVISAETRDVDGFVSRVEFFANGSSIGVVSNNLNAAGSVEQLFQLKWEDVRAGEYALTAKATDNRGAMTTSEPVRIKVSEDNSLPVITIEAADPWASEGDLELTPIDVGNGNVALIGPPVRLLPRTATFVVKRNRATNVDLLVYYSLDGTAANGVDYRRLSGEVKIPAGSRTARIVVDPIDDDLVEGTETIIARLEPIACPAVIPTPPECYVVGEPGRAIASIRDNDFANRPPFVRLVFPQDGDVFLASAEIRLVAFAQDAEDGYDLKVEFFEGTNSLGFGTFNPTKCATFCPNYVLTWSNVPPGSYVLSAVATDSGGASARSGKIEIKVTDRSEPTIVTVSAPDPKASEGGIDIRERLDAAGVLDPAIDPVPNTATFTVKRSGPANMPLTVFYRLSGTASNGVDYRELPDNVVIRTGSRTADIVVQPIDDRLVEGPETVILTVVVPRACLIENTPVGSDCYLVGRPHAAEAIIYDNDAPHNRPPFVRLNSPQNGDVFRAPADIVLHAYAQDAEDNAPLRVEFFEGINSLGLGTFVPTLCPAPICPFYALVWSNVPPGQYVLTAVATDSGGASARSEPVEIKVASATEPSVVNIVGTDREAREQSPLVDAAPDTATFKVTRTGETNDALTVYVRIGGSADNGVDYRSIAERVTIPAGSFSAEIVVDPIDDLLCEGDESVLVTLVPPVCIAIFPPPADCYVVGGNSAARAVIHDNEECPTNRPPRVAITSPHSGQIFEAPGQIPVMALAVDPDGWVPLVEFFDGTNKIGEAIIVFIVAPPPGQTQEFTIRWLNVPAGRHRLTAKATDDRGGVGWSAPVDILVAEPSAEPIVSIVAADAYAREGSPPNLATFRLRRTGKTNDALRVFYSIRGTASNGVDYVKLDTSTVISPGRRSARIVVTPIEDRVAERIETVVLRLELPPVLNPLPPPYQIGHPARAGAIIVDNDQPRPRLVALPDRTFHLQMDGIEGLCYRIECSSDLTNWEALCTCTVLERAIHFLDTDAADHPVRFYRLVRDVCDELSEEE